MGFFKWEAVKHLKELGSNFPENNIVGKTKHEIFTSVRQTCQKPNANEVLQMKLSLISVTEQSPADIQVGKDQKRQWRSDPWSSLRATRQRDPQRRLAREASGVTVPGAKPQEPTRPSVTGQDTVGTARATWGPGICALARKEHSCTQNSLPFLGTKAGARK